MEIDRKGGIEKNNFMPKTDLMPKRRYEPKKPKDHYFIGIADDVNESLLEKLAKKIKTPVGWDAAYKIGDDSSSIGTGKLVYSKETGRISFVMKWTPCDFLSMCHIALYMYLENPQYDEL